MNKKFFMGDFILGFTTPLRAFGLIRKNHPLLLLCFAPWLVAVLVFTLLTSSLLGSAWAIAHSTYLSFLSSYSGIAFAIFAILFITATAFFASSLFNLIISLSTSPFNDLLAEKTEHCLGVIDIPAWTMGRGLRILWLDLRKTAIALMASLIFSMGMLIPFANLLFFVGLSLLNAFTFITYPQTRREQGLRESARWMKHHLQACLGFGMATTLIMSIPFIGVLTLPISVVGGTLLYLEIKSRSTNR